MASLTVSSSDLTASFIATSLGPSSPKDNRTSTLMFPMYTPDKRKKKLPLPVQLRYYTLLLLLLLLLDFFRFSTEEEEPIIRST
ncbi:hypothetical protein Ahy_A03g016544 isoform I [Arachis hypogaea]|uniref:Uncharacterized protein n=1 Tax=Arachis hypogaea TaxID=3818 RepID=A0A445E3T6_ARAHY|nr:hypothetical protein Ahy_A03g016544 isoform I [Arachis hypogaea]